MHNSLQNIDYETKLKQIDAIFREISGAPYGQITNIRWKKDPRDVLLDAMMRSH